MKTRYKYITFHKRPLDGTWVCCTNSDGYVLGKCSYYGAWGQWVLGDIGCCAEFSADCLDDIAAFLRQLNEVKR